MAVCFMNGKGPLILILVVLKLSVCLSVIPSQPLLPLNITPTPIKGCSRIQYNTKRRLLIQERRPIIEGCCLNLIQNKHPLTQQENPNFI